MTKTVEARFANGVFTPLERVDFQEGAPVVLNIDAAGVKKPESAESGSMIIPNHSGLPPGIDDPKRLKQMLDDEDVEHYQNPLQRDS